MNVQPEIVARPVRELFLIAFGPDVVERCLMNLLHRHAWLDHSKSLLLSIENDLVNLALARCELSADRVGSCHVSSVSAIFGADIDNHQISGLHLPGAGIVVKYS